MNANSPKQIINAARLKLIVGFIALSLASLTDVFAASDLTSISASYYEEGMSQTLFVGSLFAIAMFLLAYNGSSTAETVASRAAGGAPPRGAVAPCGCG